jgi:hypothetical protein
MRFPFVLKPSDPLFRKQGKTVLPIKITGTRDKASLGLILVAKRRPKPDWDELLSSVNEFFAQGYRGPLSEGTGTRLGGYVANRCADMSAVRNLSSV